MRKNRAGPGAARAEKSGRGVPRVRGGGAGEEFVLDRAAETRGRAVNAVRADEGRNGRGKKQGRSVGACCRSAEICSAMRVSAAIKRAEK